MPISLEMSLTRDEFFRLLPGAVGLYALSDGGLILGGDATRRWSIQLQRLEDRTLGIVSLPRHCVSLNFEGYTEPEVEAFIQRFHRAFQRGGG